MNIVRTQSPLYVYASLRLKTEYHIFPWKCVRHWVFNKLFVANQIKTKSNCLRYLISNIWALLSQLHRENIK